jgi:hypothetical protein
LFGSPLEDDTPLITRASPPRSGGRRPRCRA